MADSIKDSGGSKQPKAAGGASSAPNGPEPREPIDKFITWQRKGV